MFPIAKSCTSTGALENSWIAKSSFLVLGNRCKIVIYLEFVCLYKQFTFKSLIVVRNLSRSVVGKFLKKLLITNLEYYSSTRGWNPACIVPINIVDWLYSRIMRWYFFYQDTVSVHRPSFYAQRFQDFMAKNVFRKISSRKFLLLHLLPSQHFRILAPSSSVSTICAQPIQIYIFFLFININHRISY